jgi:co-chaperonin GroES (HSP10)
MMEQRFDIKTFTPHGKWLVVKGDARVKKTKGGIELPDMQLQAERVMEGTGHILKVGTDTEAILDYTGGVELEPGMRVFFRGFLKDAFSEFTTDEDGQPIFLLRVEDIMGIIDEDVVMGAFS